jgi:HEPN domain-containing protein
MGVVSVTQAYEINPELRNAEAFDELYFESLPDVDKEQYVKTISMILEMDEAQLLASEDFKKWTGDEGQIHGPFPGRHSNAKWQRLYAESMGQKVTTQLSSADTTIGDFEPQEEAGGGGGGGPQASSLDDLLKKLREVRQSTIEMTQGWVESRNALDRLFNDGGEIKIFQGVEQQMRKLGAGEDLISMIVGMDPEEYERRKHELFQFDNMGNIIGATTALENMGKALRAIALGDFQSEQQRVIGGINEQLVAFRKLTAAGLSAAMAYEALKDAAFASAVAREKDNSVIREAIRLTAKAVTLNRALAAAQALARKNQETADLSGVARFIEQNAASLSDVQKQAILSDPDLQTLIMNPSVDPKTLRKALANAADQAELDLKIKKLTFDGLQEIFQDGFSKAMEAFSAKETEITIEFDVKKDPFLDIIQEAEEAISDIRNRAGGLDDLDADMERISRQEADINKTYDSRIEALDKIEKINQTINRNKKSQLDVADALSRGDIAGAARAAQQAAEEAASASLASRRDQLELSREKEISSLVGNMGLTREQLEERIKNLQIEIFEIEEQRLEPAQRQVELLDRSQAVLIESLTVLGRTREEWEAIQNQVNLANVNSERFQAALQEALNVVEDIQNYWEDLNGTEVDLFVNVRQQGSVDDIIASIEAPAPRADPGSGGGASKEEIMDSLAGRGAMDTVQRGSSLVEDARTPLTQNRGDWELADRASTARFRVEEVEEALETAEARLAVLRPLQGTLPDASSENKIQNEINELEAEVAAGKASLPTLQRDATTLTTAADANASRIAAGDPMAVFNTGAANLLDASAFIFENIARDAEGQITGNIAGYFRELGVNVPTFMSAIPGFFNLLPETVKDNVQNGIAEQFRILAANVDNNLVGISNVFASMPETARVALQDKITPMLAGLGLDGTQSLENISEWWDDLPVQIQDQVRPLIEDQLLLLGEQAFTDLEGTIGQYWDVLPASVKDILENEITPALRAEAEKMGISVEELLVQKFKDMPQDTKDAITEGLQVHWDTMQVQALQSIAGVGEGINKLGDIDPDLERNIGNALRGAAAEGTLRFKEVQTQLAGMSSASDVTAAFGPNGSLVGVMNKGADLAVAELDVIADELANVPEDERVTNSLDTLEDNFGQSGHTAGNKFGSGAISRISAAMATYQRTNPAITITVRYRDEAGRAVDRDGNLINDGGFISSSMVPRNNGGPIPYGKGGIAKYGMGGMAKYLAGGVVGGFGNYDNVPAILTPGEFVIRREAVEKYGKNFFANLNSTIYNKKPKFSTPEYGMSKQEASIKSDDSSKSQVMYNNNYSVSVNVKSDSNPDQIARTVIDQIKRIDSQRIRGNRF